MMTRRLVVLLLFVVCALAVSDCDVSFRQIRPSDTGSDGHATDNDARHWVYPGSSSSSKAEENLPLRVFLPGTGGHPNGESYLLKSIAACRNPTIGLSYAYETKSDAGRDKACADKYADNISSHAVCLGDQHADAVWGGNSQPDLWAAIAPRNSISGRLSLLLDYLAMRYPEESWSTYLDAAKHVRWDRVVVGGHSQGSGHTGFLAQATALRGAVLLSGPQDDSAVPNLWLDSKSWATSRVVAAKHAKESAQDIIGANWQRMAGALNWPNRGEPWDLGNGFASPPYGPVVSHVQPATVMFPRPYHCSMALDLNTPVNGTNGDGTKRALYGIALWPGLYDLAAGEKLAIV